MIVGFVALSVIPQLQCMVLPTLGAEGQDGELLKQQYYDAVEKSIGYYKRVAMLEPFEESEILTSRQRQELARTLNKLHSSTDLSFLYKGDGSDMKAFHDKCDGHGQTITVIRSKEGYTFVGYTDVPWSSEGGFSWKTADPTTFCITWRNMLDKDGIKCPVTNCSRAVRTGDPKYGPCVGFRVSDGTVEFNGGEYEGFAKKKPPNSQAYDNSTKPPDGYSSWGHLIGGVEKACSILSMEIFSINSYKLENSSILQSMGKAESKKGARYLDKWLSASKTACWTPELLYRASRDGWDARHFHSRCDNQGPTLTLIQTTDDYIFGGYNPIDWTSNSGGRSENAPEAWLFALRCYAKLPPTLIPIRPEMSSKAIYNNPSYLPTFGHTPDIGIHAGQNGPSNSVNIKETYKCPEGQNPSEFMTGSPKFEKKEVEIFKIKFVG